MSSSSKTFILRLSLVAFMVLGLAASARARTVYVRADAAPDSADGTRERPFRRITDALHQIEMFAEDEASAEDNRSERFVVDIGPGTYVGAYSGALLAAHPEWEVLPLWVNVSNIEVSGATRIVSGLHRGESLGLVDDTLVTVGEEIVSVTPNGLASDTAQVMMVLGPTGPGRNLHNVRIKGLHFDGIYHDGIGVYIDRVSSFSITATVFERLGAATRSRGSNGSWSRNYATANMQAAILTGGSILNPANLRLVGDRCVGNDVIGVLLNPTGSYALTIDPGQSGRNSAPIQTVFDLSNPADRRNVPDTLQVQVYDGDYSDNGLVGLRVFELGIRTNTYTTAALDQPISSHLDATFASNAFERNGSADAPFGYGVSLDAGFPSRKVKGLEQPVFTGTYELHFADNTFSGNLTASLFAGFTRFGISTVFKPLRNAIIDILEDEAIDSVYDNPQCDPFDPTHTPLGNALTVNGTVIPHGAPFCP
jgi:hypothetical protein